MAGRVVSKYQPLKNVACIDFVCCMYEICILVCSGHVDSGSLSLKTFEKSTFDGFALQPAS